MLTDSGEWQDVGPVRNVTFEPFEQESTSERVTMSTGSEWSLSMNYVGGDASTLRELFERLEREARRKRWAERMWMRALYRAVRHFPGCTGVWARRLAPLGVTLLPWQEAVADAVLSGQRLDIDWRRRG